MRDYNGLTKELDCTYFPQVKCYRDNKKTIKIHYICELFNNGCATLEKTAKQIAKIVKQPEEKIEETILKYYTL